MPRDPRDVAIDALVQTRGQLSRTLEIVNARIADLKREPALESKKHACPHPGCGLRFYRADQVSDHLELVHQVGA
jgi:hypothetical protein